MHKYLICLLMLALSACAGMTPQARRQHADALATAKGWQKLLLPSGDFVLTAYVPAAIVTSDTLTVYIEGDGFAWLTSSQPSSDPTPRDPIGLKLALKNTRGAAAYLARPCQYMEESDARECAAAYWTDRRFALQVIEASDRAIDALKQRAHADKLMLVGYSGGGAVAALVAARRRDVVQLVTIAGNLDHPVWTTLHRVSPLTGSLNPADAWRDLQNIPQMHFVGGRDKNMPVEIVNAYRATFPEYAGRPCRSFRMPTMHAAGSIDGRPCWMHNRGSKTSSEFLLAKTIAGNRNTNDSS